MPEQSGGTEEDFVIGSMFHGKHALMLVNGVPTNVHTGRPAFPPPNPTEHPERTVHAAESPASASASAPTALDTLGGFNWREEGV